MGRLEAVWELFDSVRYSYALKFVLTLVLVLAALALFGAGIFLQTSKMVEQNVEETVTAQATVEAAELKSWLDANERPVRLASADSIYRNGTDAEIQRYLQTVRDDRLAEETYDLHYLHYPDGDVLASTNEEMQGGQLSDRPWYPSLLFGDVDGVFVSAPYTTEDGRSVMAFVSPVNDVPERHLVLIVPTEDRNAAGQPSDGAFTNVVDSQGQVIFPANGSQPVQPYIADENESSTAVRQGIAGESGFLENHEKNDELNRNVVVGYAPVEGTDWTVIEHVPKDEAYQNRTAVQWAILLLLGGGISGLLLFGLTVGRRTVRDIRGLSQRAAAIEAGNYETSLDTDRSDELGSLYESIDGMRNELVDRIEEAQTAKETAVRNTEQFRVVDRLLRHNLQNRLNIITLNAETLARKLPDDDVEETTKILEVCDDILAKIDKQRLITTAMASETEPTRIDIGEEIEALCEQLTTEYPTVTIDCDTPGTVVANAQPRFTKAVHELIWNGIKHNDQEEPAVTIRVRDHEDTVEIHIEDNGPGLPEVEREIIEGDQEIDQLRHSSGVGLWMVRWIIHRSGGIVTFVDRDPRGTVARIDLAKSDTGDETRDEDSDTTQ